MQNLRPEPLAGIRAAADWRDSGSDRFAAFAVISAASAWPVWSFHSQACAASFFLNFDCSASGVPSWIDRNRRRTGRIDADADDVLRLEAAFALRGRYRAADRREKAVDVIGRALPREIRIFLIEQHARSPLG